MQYLDFIDILIPFVDTSQRKAMHDSSRSYKFRLKGVIRIALGDTCFMLLSFNCFWSFHQYVFHVLVDFTRSANTVCLIKDARTDGPANELRA